MSHGCKATQRTRDEAFKFNMAMSLAGIIPLAMMAWLIGTFLR